MVPHRRGTDRADFESSDDSMIVTLEAIGEGELHATFEFVNREGRVDDHTFVPVE